MFEASYIIRFRFPLQQPGEYLIKELRTNLWHFQSIKLGDMLSIRYLPTKPNLARLVGKDASNLDRLLETIFCIITVVPLLLVAIFALGFIIAKDMPEKEIQQT